MDSCKDSLSKSYQFRRVNRAEEKRLLPGVWTSVNLIRSAHASKIHEEAEPLGETVVA